MKNYLEAFAVREDAERSYWTKVGVAFPMKNGGFSLLLDAIPASANGQYKLVIMPVKGAEEEDTFADPYYPHEPGEATPMHPRSRGNR